MTEMVLDGSDLQVKGNWNKKRKVIDCFNFWCLTGKICAERYNKGESGQEVGFYPLYKGHMELETKNDGS